MKCDQHNLELIRETSKYGDLWVCPLRTCSYAVSAGQTGNEDIDALPISRPFHGPSPYQNDSRQGEAENNPTERLLVARIIAKLEGAGYEVLRVGQYRAKGSGTDEGYPDLSCRHPSKFPPGIVCLLEVKTAEGRVRKRQAELNAAGWSHIVRSAEQALEVMDNAARQVADVVGGREGDG